MNVTLRTTAAVILSAGESSRMGTPKALLPLLGGTFLGCLIGKVQAAGCAPVIVVLGHEAGVIRRGVHRDNVQFALNRDYAQGMLSSLQCGLRSVPEGVEQILFTLVDHPNPSAETLAALIGEPDAPVAIPRYQGRKGHPVRIARAVAQEILALPVSGTAKDVLNRYPDRTVFLDCDDAGIVDDVDDPAAYRNLLARLGQTA